MTARRASWTMALAGGPLALWGLWVLWISVSSGRWVVAAAGALALVTAAGLMLLQRWAQPLGYLFAAWLVLAWLYAVARVISRGWPFSDWGRSALFLAPGVLYVVVCLGGAWVIRTEYRNRGRAADP